MTTPALVLVNNGALGHLDALRVAWLPSLRIGLFQNDWHPHQGDTMVAVVPATFSGYTGLHFLPGWSPAVLQGNLAVTQATPRLWTHNGGPVGNWIFGYYVVDATGVLRWAQRYPGDPVPMDSSSGFYRVTPEYAVTSRFTGLE